MMHRAEHTRQVVHAHTNICNRKQDMCFFYSQCERERQQKWKTKTVVWIDARTASACAKTFNTRASRGDIRELQCDQGVHRPTVHVHKICESSHACQLQRSNTEVGTATTQHQQYSTLVHFHMQLHIADPQSMPFDCTAVNACAAAWWSLVHTHTHTPKVEWTVQGQYFDFSLIFRTTFTTLQFFMRCITNDQSYGIVWCDFIRRQECSHFTHSIPSNWNRPEKFYRIVVRALLVGKYLSVSIRFRSNEKWLNNLHNCSRWTSSIATVCCAWRGTFSFKRIVTRVKKREGGIEWKLNHQLARARTQLVLTEMNLWSD